MYIKNWIAQTGLITKHTSLSGILPLDFPFSGLCDVIDIDEQYLGSTAHWHMNTT